MPLDGLFLHKLSLELNILVNGKINKVSEVSETDFIFSIRSNYKNYNLLISLSSDFSRIHLTKQTYEFPLTPKGITMFLRKHFEGNIINNIYTYNLDRTIVFETSGFNEIGDNESKKLIIELMGRYTNLIVVKNDIIIEAFKHIGPLDGNRTILPGASFKFLDDNKINPLTKSIDELRNIFELHNFSTSKEIISVFSGISPLLANYIINSKDKTSSFYNLIHGDIEPVKFNLLNKKVDFYFKDLSFTDKANYESLSSLIDDYFYDLSKKERIKQKTNDLSLFINRQIDKLEKKLLKLESDLIEAKNYDQFRLYGELLIANSYIKEKSSSITVTNYYTNENITISLDRRYSVIDNSKIYFKKYQKGKNAIVHILEQQQKTNDEIEYFNLIKGQLSYGNVNDVLEIQEELNNLKYLNIQKKKGKAVKPKILCYTTDEGTTILVGKNNIQNELITHKIAKPNQMWFHVKDAPGSHVLVQKESPLTESDIRIAANIAAYYSIYKDSSSVPVNYTLARYIKKIPGKKNCFVSISNEKTIFIDPSINLINDLSSSYITK